MTDSLTHGGRVCDPASRARLRSAVVICTMNRPRDLELCLASIAEQSVRPPVVVVDASSDDASREVCARASASFPLLHLPHSPGLTAQRNAGVRSLDADVEIVHFIDDDVRLLPGYFDAILGVFERDDDERIGGAAPLIAHEHRTFGASGASRVVKRAFLLQPRPGRVARSGRNALVIDTPTPVEVDWLPGAAMSYRRAAFDAQQFDERLHGYSWGEDMDFSFRLGRRGWKLVVTPDARVVHTVSQVNRPQVRALARRRTALLHRWVMENRVHGLRAAAFWWSVVGEVLLAFGRGTVYRHGDGIPQAMGVLEGAVDLLWRRRGSDTELR